MNSIPDTRTSLLIRVRNPADQAAWEEFVEIYRPVILRLARKKGMQDADAEDVAQKVFLAVAKAVQEREHDARRAKFRTWLHQVAHNAILNALTRGKPDREEWASCLKRLMAPSIDMSRSRFWRRISAVAGRRASVSRAKPRRPPRLYTTT